MLGVQYIGVHLRKRKESMNPHDESAFARYDAMSANEKRVFWIFIIGCIAGVFVMELVSPPDPVPDDLVVYNHTGDAINVSIGRGDNVIQNNSVDVIKIYTTPFAYPHAHDRPSPVLFVMTAKKAGWSYFYPRPPKEYWIRRSDYQRYKIASEYQIKGIAFGYQIEADGVIYAVKPDTNKPVDTLPPQPPGFPLIPSPS